MRTPRTLPALCSLFLLVLAWNCAPAPEESVEMKTPELEGYWSAEQVDTILKKTLRLRLAPDLSAMSTPEKAVLEKLLAVGEIFQKLYEQSLHHQAIESGQRLEVLHEELEGSGVMVNALHPATYMPTGMVLRLGVEPRATIDEGATAVMQLVSSNSIEGGQFFNGLDPQRAHDQAYDMDSRRRLRELSRELTGIR